MYSATLAQIEMRERSHSGMCFVRIDLQHFIAILVAGMKRSAILRTWSCVSVLPPDVGALHASSVTAVTPCPFAPYSRDGEDRASASGR